ncbi:hypothetical protein [Nocardioides dongkuii]|uniref:hypothetical protein n=1 Tax=Nocardioides dongkuii TaxID=2760089 RepID=UPI0015FD03E3|nr:hypothetical protein [Nocardioides dongkuii]
MSTYGPPEGHPPGAPAVVPRWELGDALRYGWAKFRANLGTVILAVIAVAVTVAIVQGVGYLVRDAMGCSGSGDTDCGGFLSLANLVSLLFSALSFVVGQIVGAGVIRASLDLTEGRAFTLATVFSPHRLPQVIVASILTGILSTVGFLLCLLPGIAFSIASQYTLYFVLDKGLGPWQAIKASVHLARTNLGPTLIWYVVSFALMLLGLLLCLVGWIVILPVVLIGQAYTYKVLSGQPVAD